MMVELDHWTKHESPDLLGAFQQISPVDLQEMDEWQIYLEEVLLCINEHGRSSALYPAWWDHLGVDLDYDLFAIKFAPPGAFEFARDDGWIREMIQSQVFLEQEDGVVALARFLGDDIERYPRFASHLAFIMDRRERRKADEAQWLIERKQREVDEKARVEAEQARQEKRKAEIISETSSLKSIDRLKYVMELKEFHPGRFPEEWADIPDEELIVLSSMELTHIGRKLDGYLSKKEKSRWKDLHSRIFLARQWVHNKEMGYPLKPLKFNNEHILK